MIRGSCREKGSEPKGWSVTGTVYPGKWSDPDRVEGAPGSFSYGLILSRPVKSSELDLLPLMGLFLLEIFCGSVIQFKKPSA